jgi:plasmid stabilization system protein ParE
VVLPPFRRALLTRFPYAVYFRETEESVQVFAVFHARRDPRELQSKLPK